MQSSLSQRVRTSVITKSKSEVEMTCPSNKLPAAELPPAIWRALVAPALFEPPSSPIRQTDRPLILRTIIAQTISSSSTSKNPANFLASKLAYKRNELRRVLVGSLEDTSLKNKLRW